MSRKEPKDAPKGGGFRFPPPSGLLPLKTTNQGGFGPPIGCTPWVVLLRGKKTPGPHVVAVPAFGLYVQDRRADEDIGPYGGVGP